MPELQQLPSPSPFGSITVRCYAELNDFLPPAVRQQAIPIVLSSPTTVKDLLEGLGIPHTEIDLILVNGQSVDFSYRPGDGDYISVYPVFETLDISTVTRLRPKPLRVPRFVADVHLGRMATYLRLLGFDTAYQRDSDDSTLAAQAAAEHRILLTRDRELLKRRVVTHGYFVRSQEPYEQVREVLLRFDLWSSAQPFTRCLRCNGTLRAIPKETVAHRLPPRSHAYAHQCWQCTHCGHVYWDGTHYQRLTALVAQLLSSLTTKCPLGPLS
jgi:uncharacterized protein with PIN domain/sulfur carrier protein ThiS